jgi:hypothetical protein
VARERTNKQLNSHEVPEPWTEPTTHWDHSGERRAYYCNVTHDTLLGCRLYYPLRRHREHKLSDNNKNTFILLGYFHQDCSNRTQTCYK